MSTTINYFLSLSSPYTFMGHERFEALAAKYNVSINYRPTNFGKVFPVSGGLPLPKRAPQRLAYRMMELKRWRAYLGIPLNLEPKFFPVSEALAARAVVAAILHGHPPAGLILAILRGVWVEERNIADGETLAEILGECGLEAPPLLEAAESEAVQTTGEGFTQEAIDKGIFGAPTYERDGELFWGQDRLEFLERALDEH